MKLRVFSSRRKIKEYFQKSKSKNSLLDKAMGVSEFLDNVCLLEKLYKASDYETLLIMQKACVKSKNLEEKLGISSEFFAFLKNKDYLFSFFKELCLEKKDIKALQDNDYYASYNEHLEILDEVLKNYFELLKQAGLYDELSLVGSYTLNFDFLEEFEAVIYDLQGFLSVFEAELLEQISKYKETILCFKTSKFNLDFLKNLSFLKDFTLENNHYYEFNLTQKYICFQKPLKIQTRIIKTQSFNIRALQVAFVLDELSDFINSGMDPENIVVITPDEKFCELLRLFDKDNALNFASGKSLKESAFYQKLRALYLAANKEDFSFDESLDYFEDENKAFDYINTSLHYLGLEFKDFKSKFDNKCNMEFFKQLLGIFLEDENTEFKSLVEKELFFMQDLLKQNPLKLKELLELFFIQISKLKLSSVGGGKVTVMGLLESRGLEFDGVIIVDFNDDFVPKRSINELFLNNDIRKKAGLISYERRENLQRFYYENLMRNAKKVSISYVENEEKMKSRFLEELDFVFENKNLYSQKAYLNALKLDYESVKPNLKPIVAPILKHNIFEKPLSFSRLNLFLHQKRTYYYRYILNLKEPRALDYEKTKAKNLGIFVHEILECYYKNNAKNSFDEKAFFVLFEDLIKNYTINPLDAEILRLKFSLFAKNELEHFKQGYEVDALELELSKDFILNSQVIKLVGKIDRIDVCKEHKLIIDYKSGKIEDKSYQLAFYKVLYDENASANFYDLNDFTLKLPKNAKDIADLKELFLKLAKEQEIKFENSKDRERFCPYKLIYKKELK